MYMSIYLCSSAGTPRLRWSRSATAWSSVPRTMYVCIYIYIYVYIFRTYDTYITYVYI